MAEGWLDTPFELAGKRIWVAGHRGMVGSAFVRRLASENHPVLTADFDFRVQRDVDAWMKDNRPDVVVIAAARVGGVQANSSYPADFLYDNLMMASNIIHAAHQYDVSKLLFLGSSCIYPKEAENPIQESALLTGALEKTNEAYAIAKIAGLKLCESYRTQHGRDFISVMPCNLYGPGDRFDAERSHVIPALLMKAYHAKMTGQDFVVWGSGKPRREFLYVYDLAEALVFCLKNYSSGAPLNIGSGQEVAIKDLAEMIADVVGFQGRIIFDASKPNGVMRKLMNSEKIFKAGWKPSVELRDGLVKAYRWYLDQELKRAA